MANTRTCGVVTTLPPLDIGVHNNVWWFMFEKYLTLEQLFFVRCNKYTADAWNNTVILTQSVFDHMTTCARTQYAPQ
jgi:hypothetical protein